MVLFSAEIVTPNKVKEKCKKKQRNRQKFVEEIVKIPSDMVHPFLHLQAEMKNI